MSCANASIVQCTIADNNLGNVVQNLKGQGILAFATTGVPTTANISYSIIANHANSFRAAAVQVFPGATANFNRNLFAANTNDLASSGTVNGHASDLQAASTGFVSPGNYQITSSSPAAVSRTTPRARRRMPRTSRPVCTSPPRSRTSLA